MLQQISISNKCYFKREKTLTKTNTKNNKKYQHITMISEGSGDTED